MKKKVLILLVAVMVGSLWACGQVEDEQKSVEGQKQEATENKEKEVANKNDVTINFMADTSLFWDVLNPLIEQFTEETGIKVNSVVLEEGNLWAKTGLELSAPSTEMNVIMPHTKDITNFMASDYLEPLDIYLDAIPSFSKEDFPSRYIDVMSKDGNLFGVPMYSVATVLEYRADIFAKHNISIPRTWDELENVCAILKEKEPDMTPFAMRAQRPDYAFSIIYRGMGGDYLNSDNKSIMDEAIAEKAISYYVDLLKNYGPEGAANYSYLEVQNDFRQGKLIMCIEDINTFTLLENPAESPIVAGKIGYDIVPEGSRIVLPGFTWILAIPKNTTHKEEAAQFIAWLMQPEISYSVGLTFPMQTWEKAYSLPAYSDYPESIPLLECMEESANHIDFDYCPRDTEFGDLKQTIITSIQECLTGTKTAQESAAEIVARSKEIY